MIGLKCGRAFYRFSEGNYDDASKILEDVLENSVDEDYDAKYLYSILRRSYARQGDTLKAIDALKRSFNLYQVSSQDTWRKEDILAYEETAREYTKLLRETGDNDQAREVEESLIQVRS